MKRWNIAVVLLLLFSALYAQQGPKYVTGLVFDDESYEKTQLKAPLLRSLYGSSLPTSVSLKKYTPIPKSQGMYRTCVGWSTAYAALTIIEARQNNWTDKATITNNTFSPGFIYSLIKYSDDNNCSYGSSINDALTTMKEMGTAKYNDLDISCPEYIPGDLFSKASGHKIKDFAKIFGLYDNNDIKIEATKKSFSENKPVVIGMKCPESFNYATGYWKPTENYWDNFGGHAMCVIGYDNNKYEGAFEIQNSWGEDWGNQGYIWIKYEDYANFTKYAFELIEEPKSKPFDVVDLSGKLKFLLADGREMKASLAGNKYKMNQSYRSGTRFRIYISNNEPAFVYAFSSDFTNNTYQIFPHNEYISPALTYKQNDVAIPDEDHYIEMDDNIGIDYLCVLYSKNLLDIDEIRHRIEQEYGTFQEKVEKTLSSQMVKFEDIEYFPYDQIGFRAKSKGKSIAVLIVETEHIE